MGPLYYSDAAPDGDFDNLEDAGSVFTDRTTGAALDYEVPKHVAPLGPVV